MPSEFRPICVSSVFLRAIHKVIANRLQPLVELSEFQLAFQRRDGLFEATSTLHTLLRNKIQYVKPLSPACLDLSRAFDTVSISSILRAAFKSGLPPLCSAIYRCSTPPRL